MDKIQKILIETGHKDLAQEYYKKIAKNPEGEISTRISIPLKFKWEKFVSPDGKIEYYFEYDNTKQVQKELDEKIIKMLEESTGEKLYPKGQWSNEIGFVSGARSYQL